MHIKIMEKYITLATLLIMKTVITMASTFPTANVRMKNPCMVSSQNTTIVYINCALKTITKELLRSFGENVRIAHLEHNNFTTLEEDVFTVWPHLKKVYLDDNRHLSTIKFHHNTIQTISFSDNGLQRVNLSDLEGLKSLKCANFAGNDACVMAQKDATELCKAFTINCGNGCHTQTPIYAQKSGQSPIAPLMPEIIVLIFFVFLAL